MNLKRVGACTLGLVVLPGLIFGANVACINAVLFGAFLAWVLQDINPPQDLTPDRPKRALLHDKFSESKLPPKIDAIVIGSGMGGLTSAAFLARTGKKVVVLEKHPDVCGGSTHSFNLEGYEFDSGFHYSVPWHGPLLELTTLSKDGPTFELMGNEEGVFDKIVMGDAAPFNVKYKEAHMAEIYKMFPEERKGIERFLEDSMTAIHMAKVVIVSRLLPKWLQPLYWKLIPRRWIELQKENMEDLMGTYIKDRKLISLLSSMWLDSGGRPDQCSWLLSACVIRGLPMEGGCYPIGGAHLMAESLVRVIEKWGGRVLIDAPVGQVNFDDDAKVSGVTLMDGTMIDAPMVVCGSGYANLFKQFVPKDISEKYGHPQEVVPASGGFVMANVGLKGCPKELGIENANTWHIPVDKDGDMYVAMREFFANPLSDDTDPPVMITFPSVKMGKRGDDVTKTSCQMLVYAEYKWFEKWETEPHGQRGEDYDAMKEIYRQKLEKVLLKHYPKVEGKIGLFDISTPLSVKQWVNSERGGCVGLDVTAERFMDPKNQELLDPVTRVPGLYLTGHDCVMPGVVMAQISGMCTAFRISGFWRSLKFIMQSVFMLD